MNQFWADFQQIRGSMYRFDTRVYLSQVEMPCESDLCLGALIGKNPGSAKPDHVTPGLSEISLDGDKCLPTISSIVLKSYQHADIDPPPRGYVQVLNLFYVCDPNLATAIQSIQGESGSTTCSTENYIYPWVWYAWGGNIPKINQLKERFKLIEAADHFFYDHAKKTMVTGKPSKIVTAKHTQGLPHQPVIVYVAQLIRKNNN